MTVYIKVPVHLCNEIALQGFASAATVFFRQACMPLRLLDWPPLSQGAEEIPFPFRTLSPYILYFSTCSVHG